MKQLTTARTHHIKSLRGRLNKHSALRLVALAFVMMSLQGCISLF